MNSFKMLVKSVKWAERTDKIDLLIKEKLIEYADGMEDVDYKIQIIEFLEDLKYIELAYGLAKKIQVNLPPDSIKVEDVRKIVRRLHTTPIAENKPNSTIDFDLGEPEEEKKEIQADEKQEEEKQEIKENID
jgi:hypothetical protein